MSFKDKKKGNVQMINILRAWGKGAQSQNLSIKEQAMMPATSTDEVELTDTQLKVAFGGCGQSGNEGYGYGQSYGGYDPDDYSIYNQQNGYNGYGNYSRHHHGNHGYNDYNGNNGYNGYNGYGNSYQGQCQPNSWQS